MRCLTAVLLAWLAMAASAADPASAVARAREDITAGRPADGLRLLRETTAAAAALTVPQHRKNALAAIHFYSAVALSALGDKEQAATELRSFLLYNPAGRLEGSHYPQAFTDLFEEVHRKVTRGRQNPASFDDAYPGFPPPVSSSSWPVNLWGASSEFLILSTPDEREQWGHLTDDAARRAFIDSFWTARDPDPSTGVNEARVELLRRIAFADVAFVEAVDDRGSLTDRGRVFVLLGPPSRVSIRPLDRREAPYAPRRTIDAGNAMEQWTYFRDQLPKKLPNNEVTFRFISDGGMATRKMQRDFLAEKAFRDAPGALKRE